MAERREAIGGTLLTTAGGAWIAAIVVAADREGSLISSLVHGAPLLLIAFGLVCAVAGAVAFKISKPIEPSAPSEVSEVGVFRIEASPVLEFDDLNRGFDDRPPVLVRTIHQVRITNQQPGARLIIELWVRITLPDGRVFPEISLSPTDPCRDWRQLRWLELPIEVEAQRTVIGEVGFILQDVEAVLEGEVELVATDLVSGASVRAALGETRTASRPAV